MPHLDGKVATGGESRPAIMRAADEQGLLRGEASHLTVRLSTALLERAKRVTGISDEVELLTYALAKVALEDDFAERLLARKGRLPKGSLWAG